MADKTRYCSRHGPHRKCDCEHPLLVHQCASPKCGVELYDPDEKYCQHHEGIAIFNAQHGTDL